MSQKKLTLIVEWFDPSASIIKQYYFSYYLPNNQIEMYDIKTRKAFLKKIQYPNISIKDLYIGNVLSCYGRQLKIIEFGDQFTKKNLLNQKSTNKTFGLIKPDCYMNIGKIIAQIQKYFIIGNMKMFRMNKKTGQTFYQEQKNQSNFSSLIDFITSDYVVGLQLIASDVINKWKQFIGPSNPNDAKKQAPSSLRAIYGTDEIKNACHGSDSLESAERQLKYIFESEFFKSQPYLTNCSLCIIKPHIIKKKQVGLIIDQILQAGYQISALQMIWFDSSVAQKFYQVYKFLPECKRMIDHLCSGPSIVLQIRQQNVVQKLRLFFGPYDPQIAKKLQPNTIRARYGVDRVQNAVHCTDLSQDGTLEVNFIFNTLIG